MIHKQIFKFMIVDPMQINECCHIITGKLVKIIEKKFKCPVFTITD